eukprot:TRINITY_DN18667_c0_g1_i1.p2 TRINITY_DN18667_c0_g1~~TRINITY_DN18667_c0_g1_i1.p2  ORF type:complete len:274 (-),score=44.41 TRINITY_DN18667_c0_g1_i1:213-1034(-)
MKGTMLDAYDSSDDSDSQADAPSDAEKLLRGKRTSADADTSQSGESVSGSVLVSPSRSRKGSRKGAAEPAAGKPSKRSKVTGTAAVRKAADGECQGSAPKGREAILAELAALQKPVAILKCEDDDDRAHAFELAIPLEESGSTKKMVTLQCLRQGKDGLYRPRTEVFEELRSALVPIRTQKPVAILKCEDDDDRAHAFELAIPLEESGSTKKMVTLQCLRQGKDGLYRPRTEVFEELRSALVPIRTQLLDPGTRKPGFKLLTLRSRILNTELV